LLVVCCFVVQKVELIPRCIPNNAFVLSVLDNGYAVWQCDNSM